MKSRLSLCAALVTPLDGDGEINAGAFASHARWVLRHGCDGVVAFGTTGESASFSTDARTAGLAALVEKGVPPAAVISSARAAPALSLTSVIATADPCSAKMRAVSAPIPDAPPLSSATFPSNLGPMVMGVLLVSVLSGGGRPRW